LVVVVELLVLEVTQDNLVVLVVGLDTTVILLTETMVQEHPVKVIGVVQL
jgi:hypothetical protein